ncbi:MAG: thioredoxin domain-containing protein [Burkholderiaceae bacterium]|jgi:protein-disulfide isomerase
MSFDDKPTLTPPIGPTDHLQGPANGAITIVEYGDFECPACEQAYSATLMLRRKYASEVRFVFRHFPLREVHPHAETAAEVSEIAAGQGKFWEMEALLFKNQLHLKPHALRGYAQMLELDMVRYDAELGDHIYLQRVQEHLESGKLSGVRNTPTFFVNGRLVDVSFGIESLFNALEAVRRGR